MEKTPSTTDEYTIFRNALDEDRVYAVHQNEVAKMNRLKDSYANGMVPDELTVEAYPVRHISVVNNMISYYDLESDEPEHVQINHLESYVVEV